MYSSSKNRNDKRNVSQTTLLHQNPRPLRINIDGTTGTGESFLISAITKTLNTFAGESGLSSPIIRVAPTGIAAFNINGSTLHKTFSIPIKFFSKLNNAQELQLQKRLKDCKYIILDEKRWLEDGCSDNWTIGFMSHFRRNRMRCLVDAVC
jgi:DNA replication protein DnaC